MAWQTKESESHHVAAEEIDRLSCYQLSWMLVTGLHARTTGSMQVRGTRRPEAPLVLRDTTGAVAEREPLDGWRADAACVLYAGPVSDLVVTGREPKRREAELEEGSSRRSGRKRRSGRRRDFVFPRVRSQGCGRRQGQGQGQLLARET